MPLAPLLQDPWNDGKSEEENGLMIEDARTPTRSPNVVDAQVRSLVVKAVVLER